MQLFSPIELGNVEGPSEKKVKLADTTSTSPHEPSNTQKIHENPVDSNKQQNHIVEPNTDASVHRQEVDSTTIQHQKVEQVQQNPQHFQQVSQQGNQQSHQINQISPFARDILPDNATFGDRSIFPETTPFSSTSSSNHQ